MIKLKTWKGYNLIDAILLGGGDFNNNCNVDSF